MTIKFYLDIYQVFSGDNLNIVNTPSDVDRFRQLIYSNLSRNETTDLCIYFHSKTLYSRFRDFEGLDGVAHTNIIDPKSLFAENKSCEVPAWITSSLIVSLDLLNYDYEQSCFEEYILNVIAPDFIQCSDFKSKIESICNRHQDFRIILNIEQVRFFVVSKIANEFELDSSRIDHLLNYLFNEQDVSENLKELMLQQHFEKLRTILSFFKITKSLPPRTISLDVINLPLIDYCENLNSDLSKKWLEVTEQVHRKITHGDFDFKELHRVLISPWKVLIDYLDCLVESNVNYLTDDFLIKLERYNTKGARALFDKLRCRKDNAVDVNFPESSDVNSVIEWSDRYLTKTRDDFVAGNIVNSDIAINFAHWLINQEARILRSRHHWTTFSKQVSKSFSDDKVVVILMIDALSSLHEDLIFETFSQIEHLNIEHSKLFAPIPTLTEIGKIAVITGKEATKNVSNVEDAILNAYHSHLSSKSSLQIFKSWASIRENRLEQDTKLVVYFENRVDEFLHKAADFNQHQNHVKTMLNSLKSQIISWQKDALQMNKAITFHITADHGVTVCRDFKKPVVQGEIKERVIKVEHRPNELDDDYTFVGIDGKNSGFLIPFDRRYFSKSQNSSILAHGGLTPEEVLIPYYNLYSGVTKSYNNFTLNAISSECFYVSGKWCLRLKISTPVNIDNFRIKLANPFSGKHAIERINEGQTIEFDFAFECTVSQEGLTDIKFDLQFEVNGNKKIQTQSISVCFPPKILEASLASKKFEGMFD
ncbi:MULTISPECIES: PglZ domain-containing protein [Shewanella]|uniref:PglZ domain-containing protein n=1 Tax=Shewanella TaxID=22 RepID=UPI000C62010B|nr:MULTISPECIES: PglZ domain-containing protein [Shewanella]NCQ46061.1 PglZ domain-containing protein [Shewanella frigidimarina]NCO70519.1 PglZ domain-containing protein [Shewanella vesiculosa]NCP36409.1 PglZ domain-containing protein [Shewanella vesiculosa]NCP69690.1 PglZ domain-containing protein [Shewanella vesiculosa]NCP74927.1 PglZ domain-containing protein [Shewanella vesiculosa]